MSEKVDLNAAQKKLAETLKGIGIDLWGTADPEQWAEKAFENAASEPRARAQERETAAAPDPEQKAEKKAAKAPARKVSIENLWMTADETVDWTEALIREYAPDGLTAPDRWSFYHRMAPSVLEGDRKAYAEVLTTLNPLGDLMEYAQGIVLRTPAADRLECEFECRPEHMGKNARRYLGAMSLRIARDLLAVLPVEEVSILGRMDGEEKTRATLKREQLLKRKMAFLDPADFIEECGGWIAEQA